ncbi:MAG: hypothetical protein CL825_04785 [Crocinitomicaceae bacterium]|nr:hypothetical protein [Crocinitomicaceae bacterium]
MDFEFERDWNKLMKLLMDRFGEQPDLTSAIFSVGLQEAGFGSRSFKKDDKVNLMHVGVCTLLEPLGYYKSVGHDKDGWPHFERVEGLPNLKPEEQELMMRRQLIEYFESWIKNDG